MIQAPGQTANIIPPGPQILMPTDVTYTVQPKVRLKNNRGSAPVPPIPHNLQMLMMQMMELETAIAMPLMMAWLPGAGLTIPWLRIKQMELSMPWSLSEESIKKGSLKLSPPVQLTTDLAPNVGAWDTAVAINPTNTDNIVVTYELIDYNTFTLPTYRAVSFDGGKTWRRKWTHQYPTHRTFRGR